LALSDPLGPNALMFEINARQLLQQTAAALDRDTATLADVPDDRIAEWAGLGFTAVWVMGVWATGAAGRQTSATDPAFTTHHAAALPDWTPEDVTGSPYAVADYIVPEEFGGPQALATLRRRLADAGLALILDFVPNHTAPDHPWVRQHPECFVAGSERDLETHPENFLRTGDGRILAFGRDPYFDGWRDTVQLDYRRAATRGRMVDTLQAIADQCDGVRCDMAMLVLSDVFQRTWGKLADGDAEGEFWADAIDAVRALHPGFRFIAEAYWGLEERLRLLGFDFTYNKGVYDAIVHHDLAGLRHQLVQRGAMAGSLQFLENHDEPRAATALADRGYRHAATVLLSALPGVRMIHDGQMEARRRQHSVHLGRRFEERPDQDERAVFEDLLGAVAASAIGKGDWQLLDSNRTWAEDDSYLAIFALLWQSPDGRRDLVVVNLAAHQSEANLPVRFQGVAGRAWRLADRLSDADYVRDGSAMCGEGLFVRLYPYEAQIFEMTRAG
jgi:glycosidase